MQQHFDLIPHPVQGGIIYQRPKDGYINATAMCQAAGKQWFDFRRLTTTSAFIEALATETGVDRHDQHKVELVEYVIEIVERRGRIEYKARFAAVLLDERNRAVDVLGRFRVERNDIGARLREIRNDAIDRLDHQVDVDRCRRMRA